MKLHEVRLVHRYTKVVGLRVARLTLDNECNCTDDEAGAGNQSSTFDPIRQYSSSKRNNVGYSVWRDGEQLSLKVFIAETRHDRRGEKGHGGDANAKAKVGDVVNPEA